MVQSIFWSVFLRTGQIAVEASTTLLIGLLVAGVMRRMLGAEGTRRLFGGEGLKGLFRAWLIGSLLPVCALGVIPVAREMRRAGVPGATILAFVLAAPQLNPLSFLYGLTLSEPIVIIAFVVLTMLIAIAGGEFWKRTFENPSDTAVPEDEPTPAPGMRRLVAVVATAARESIGPGMAYVLLAIGFTGLLAGLLPHGCLSNSMKHEDWTSPLLMTLIGTPAYSGVLPGMMRIGLIFEHGNSVGASFILFEFGVGMNLGLIAWLAVQFGWRRITLWLAGVVLAVLVTAVSIEYPLYFAHEEASHTHAFDDWTSPFAFGAGGDWQMARDKIMQKVEVLEPFALVGLAFLIVGGLIVRRLDRQGAFEAWLTREAPVVDGAPSIWNRPLPGPVLGLAVLAGLVAFSIAALYIYYPESSDAFDEMVRVRANALTAVRSGHKEEGIRQIQQWDLLTRKLQVGVFIRTGTLNAEHGKVAEDLRERLEEMRDALLADDLDAAKEHITQVEEAYRSCRRAYSRRGVANASAQGELR